MTECGTRAARSALRAKAKGKSGGDVSFALSSALQYDDTAGQFIFAFCLLPFALPPQVGRSF